MLSYAKSKPYTRRKTSKQRRNLTIATWEGVPSTIFQTLLGGQVLEWIAHWPKWIQVFGMQLAVGTGMILLVVSLGRRILRDAS
ncbi:hypothetical protein HMSSN036_35080 [Paenibacillus macerans]|uniref:hypothetical protein n=1 Tax=Paenibacillus sp. FSL R5-0527 TaxID=2975321 RepID=UPI00097B24E5|nr:hypothetical protein BK140_18105 [Paenibacillus macerans]GJM71292.1 hypothetical protein HMSSN036_35080 [Paenibacillus macerans]